MDDKAKRLQLRDRCKADQTVSNYCSSNQTQRQPEPSGRQAPLKIAPQLDQYISILETHRKDSLDSELVFAKKLVNHAKHLLSCPSARAKTYGLAC